MRVKKCLFLITQIHIILFLQLSVLGLLSLHVPDRTIIKHFIYILSYFLSGVEPMYWFPHRKGGLPFLTFFLFFI